MITALDVFILGMATWRITSLLVREQGPWKIFERIRELSGIKHDEDGNVLEIPDNFFADVLSCVWCCSIWVAFGWSIVFFYLPGNYLGGNPLCAIFNNDFFR